MLWASVIAVDFVSDATRASRRQYYRAGLIGGLLAGVVFIGVLMNGDATLLRADPIGGFYDLQAHSLLRFHWDVPAKPLGFEAFLVRGKAYTYYGPFPALLRLPSAALTDRLDGRLTQLSMLCAFAVALAFTVRLTWRTRALVRRNAPLSRGELWAVGAFTFAVGAGSVILFMASRAFVYHEAELWGAALALGAFEFIVALAISPTTRNLVAASLLAAMALLSRASVGAGPVVALGLLLVVSSSSHLRRIAGLSGGSFRRALLLPLGVAALIPVMLYAAVNYAKFGTLFSLPNNKQLFSQLNAARQAALAANDNSLFGLKFVPTTLVQSLRPDAIRLDGLFPWINFPDAAHVIGNVRFDTIDLSSSIPASMPALTALAVIGLISIVRAPPSDEPTLAVLRIPVLGAIAGACVTLTVAFIAHRYLSDVVPALVLAGIAGLHVLVRWSEQRSRGPKRRFTWIWAGFGVLVAISVWFNLGLAILYQRQLNPAVTETELSSFVDFQYGVHRRIPGGPAPNVQRGTRLPPVARRRGTVFIVGDCAGVYWSSGTAWRALEGTPATGHWRFRARFPPRPPLHRWQPVLVSGTPGTGNFVAVRFLRGNRLVFGFLAEGTNRGWRTGSPVAFDPRRFYELEVVDDNRIGRVQVLLDGRSVLETLDLSRPTQDATVGRTEIGGPVAPTFAGTLEDLPASRRLCRRLTA